MALLYESEDEEDTESFCARFSTTIGKSLAFEPSDQEGEWQEGGVYCGEDVEDLGIISLTNGHTTNHHNSFQVEEDDTSNLVPPDPSNGKFEEDDEDDGWNSDPEGFCALPVSPNKSLDVYRSCGYGEWEDEVKAMFASSWKKEPEKVRALLREMFEEHENIHDLICFFLRRAGKKRLKGHTLNRELLEEFKKWKKEKANNLPKNAILTAEHQKEVLGILARSHTLYLAPLCSIFELRSVPKGELVALVEKMLESGHHKEAVTYVFTFGLQKHFKIEKMLLPLVALDKVNLIERYIEDEEDLQIEFVRLLDQLSEPGSTKTQISHILSECKWLDVKIFDNPNSKLNTRQVLKLGLRFMIKYKLDLDLFPNMAMKKSSGFIHHILHLHYIDETITDENIDDLVESAVMDNDPKVQLQLIYELVQFNDVPAAAKWSVRCGLSRDSLPCAVQMYLSKQRNKMSGSLYGESKVKEKEKDKKSHDFLALSVPFSSILFVDRRDKLQLCWEAIAKYRAIIGIDSEWKLVYNPSMERLAVMQLAVENKVFILDMIALPLLIAPKILRHFMHNLFGSKNNIKLGYGIVSDLKMLEKSWPFAADIISDPKKLIDLQALDLQIQKLLQSMEQRQVTPPTHPLLETTPTNNIFPVHPLLAMYGELGAEKDETDGESISSADDGISLESNAEWKSPSGLSLLVERYLGKPLDKSQQLSDWERRPLRNEQMKYAALDAHCLLQLYQCLKSKALSLDPHFNTTPFLCYKSAQSQPQR